MTLSTRGSLAFGRRLGARNSVFPTRTHRYARARYVCNRCVCVYVCVCVCVCDARVFSRGEKEKRGCSSRARNLPMPSKFRASLLSSSVCGNFFSFAVDIRRLYPHLRASFFRLFHSLHPRRYTTLYFI